MAFCSCIHLPTIEYDRFGCCVCIHWAANVILIILLNSFLQYFPIAIMIVIKMVLIVCIVLFNGGVYSNTIIANVDLNYHNECYLLKNKQHLLKIRNKDIGNFWTTNEIGKIYKLFHLTHFYWILYISHLFIFIFKYIFMSSVPFSSIIEMW